MIQILQDLFKLIDHLLTYGVLVFLTWNADGTCKHLGGVMLPGATFGATPNTKQSVIKIILNNYLFLNLLRLFFAILVTGIMAFNGPLAVTFSFSVLTFNVFSNLVGARDTRTD